MLPTKLLYLEDSEERVFTAKVVAVGPGEREGVVDVVLDQTMFYPRGGGQESDGGEIASTSAVFKVQETRFAAGVVHHLGVFVSGNFTAGDLIEGRIDTARRFLNSRLHTAGHVIDEAVRNLGLGWAPTKGIHFPGQSAVEYSGTCDDMAAAAARIEAEANRLLQSGTSLSAALVDAAELPAHAYFIPPNLPGDKPIRVVTIGDDKGVPCGGTHVKDIAEVGVIKIRYVKPRKDAIKVAYELQSQT